MLINRSKYENIILLGDCNSCVLNSSMKAFCETHKFRSLLKKAICFRNPENPSCIDLILKNKHLRFQRSCAIITLHKKMKFSIKDSSVNVTKSVKNKYVLISMNLLVKEKSIRLSLS